MALWTQKQPLIPEGYEDYILCRHIYHCTPAELEKQPAIIVRRDLAFWNAEQQVARIKRQTQQRNGG